MKLSAVKSTVLVSLIPAFAMLAGCGATTSVEGAGSTMNEEKTPVVTDDAPVDRFSRFSARLLESAGSTAVDCGVVPVSNPSAQSDQCLSDMFNASAPFYVIYEKSGIDSTVADGVSRDGAGVLRLWSYDSNMSGGAGDGAESITARVCTHPSLMNVSAQSVDEKVGCFISLNQFQQQMIQTSGPDANLCGTVAIDQSPQLVDACVRDALANQKAFVATYMLRGIDSTVAQGLSSSASGVSFLWNYDSSVTGQGDQGPSRVVSTYCSDLKPIAVIDDAGLNTGFTTESVLKRFSC